jgi:hypothetical protein
LSGKTAKYFGKAILLLDRLFLTVPALTALDEVNANGQFLHIVTKAKSNCKAYQLPKKKEKKRGRPNIVGEPVKVFTLFETAGDQFITAEAF